jgi:hypothetical protein
MPAQLEILRKVPFISRSTFASATSAAGAATWENITTTNTEWLEFTIACATNDVTVVITPLAGTATTQLCVAGNSYTVRVLVNYVATTLVQIQDTVGGAHGVMTGKYVHHGMFKI